MRTETALYVVFVGFNMNFPEDRKTLPLDVKKHTDKKAPLFPRELLVLIFIIRNYAKRFAKKLLITAMM